MIDSANALTGLPDGKERRAGNERRNFTLATLSRCLVNPRRGQGRRSADRRYPKQDVFDGSAMLLAVLLTVFSLADATMTLILLGRGGTELNPVMRVVIESGGIAPFIIVKMMLTVIPAIILVSTQNLKVFGLIRVRSILAAMVGGYFGLLLYEVLLLSVSA